MGAEVGAARGVALRCVAERAPLQVARSRCLMTRALHALPVSARRRAAPIGCVPPCHATPSRRARFPFPTIQLLFSGFGIAGKNMHLKCFKNATRRICNICKNKVKTA